MYIKRLSVQNVKSFRQETVFDLGRGVNYLVGDNNGGKSTVLESLLFLFEGSTAYKWRPDTFYSTNADGPTRVVVDISGGVEELVRQGKYALLQSFLFEDDGEVVLRLERSSQMRTVVQSGKDKSVDVKAVCFWHPERQQFENVTGIDAKVKAIFDFEAIWADAQPGDHIDFANTKTLGRLLDAAFTRFAQTERWKSLVTAHGSAFADDDEESFLVETEKLANDIKSLVEDQYGHAAMRFEFTLPDPSVFMKQGRLHVDDGAGETPVEGKGSGMQRAIALGIIQLYAKAEHTEDTENTTPLILMLDEPETWLHPSAQLRLGDALSVIGERDQVFIITHSPYLIRKFDSRKHRLTVIAGQDHERKIDTSTSFGLFGVGEPTWGEINYRAFGMCSHDFHNELYGFIQKHLDDKKPAGKSAKEEEVDAFLVFQGLKHVKIWERHASFKYPTTVPGYVRNSIHHPENTANIPVTDADLRIATDELVSVVERLVESGNAGVGGVAA
ncbi:ATP-dependent endonuclease [Cryobacterium sp. M15]|uniref:ATP-dependent nuclease n=1 Tax=Cryobacterium sp. M15 TaxID=2048291 RepID=UPI0021012AB1|nr:AAA family ATPase [Cryobacterium sp. M15]